ncbi:hypothetical protein QYE76_002436 [Lolium multiflorum]|uniref:Uncharacterized protein n=1 Tax=Lolium multiflorum TaxID=4521 RepID=A0AAD8RQK8_LOLMU|nr:hypothetical protein QYE76_002436 [Lolium multiflorum]
MPVMARQSAHGHRPGHASTPRRLVAVVLLSPCPFARMITTIPASHQTPPLAGAGAVDDDIIKLLPRRYRKDGNDAARPRPPLAMPSSPLAPPRSRLQDAPITCPFPALDPRRRRRPCRTSTMEGAYPKFYQLGNGGDLVFERDLDLVSEELGRPHPEFHGVRINNQPGGEPQWMITADLRGKMEPPTSERILFSIKASNWMDGLARALQEALARVCGQNIAALQDRKELDNARVHANRTRMALAHHADAIRLLAKDRKSLRCSPKKDATITRLRAKILTMETTVKAQEDQLKEMEEDGEDIQGGEDFLSDDDDFEEDEFR